jgi:hypothetical protein
MLAAKRSDAALSGIIESEYENVTMSARLQCKMIARTHTSCAHTHHVPVDREHSLDERSVVDVAVHDVHQRFQPKLGDTSLIVAKNNVSVSQHVCVCECVCMRTCATFSSDAEMSTT